jgi:hypothetical protein
MFIIEYRFVVRCAVLSRFLVRGKFDRYVSTMECDFEGNQEQMISACTYQNVFITGREGRWGSN